MKKFIIYLISLILMSLSVFHCCVLAEDTDIDLYAISAVLIDADSGRILYGKNENEVRAMASTTKIMTLMIALEYGNMEDKVVFSSYACREPDVQLNALPGEQYTLKDLLYIMMLRSYNDAAMAVAEYAGGIINGDTELNTTREESEHDVKAFVARMNEKAKELGCTNTYFITPNGLDASDENGKHSTTAYELALIAAEAVSNPCIVEICTTRSYNYRELNGKRSGNITNTDLFLDMVNGAIGLKTGFTGEAGYCFVGAVRQQERTFISVVLGSGWPNNKNYKWSDTRKLMNYGISNFFYENIIDECGHYRDIDVINGLADKVGTYIPIGLDLLVSESDKIDVIYEIKEYLNAPVRKNEEVGRAYIYVNNELFKTLPVLTDKPVEKKDYGYYLKKVAGMFCV